MRHILVMLLVVSAQTPAPQPAPSVQAQPPACGSPKYSELDFWLGEWDARGANVPADRPPNSSVITKVHGGCVILETWKSPNYSGQSFNIYDRTRGKWHQTWVDSGGGLQEFWGSLKDGNMVYEGTAPPAKGQTVGERTRMTFFNLAPGKVRQLVERSSDGGKTWKVQYDFAYTRKASSTTASPQ
jgi:hypothetical protein